jgi:NIMA (never in mitosis gene a)-related kinase
MASLAEAARTAAAPAPATRQESLGDYVVLRELHRSEVGAVFLARRRADGVGVVLKERRASELGRERPLDNEAALYARLAHPNVLRCEGHFFDGPHHSLFLVLELCRGGDLWSLLERQRRRRSYVPEPRVWGMLAQLADALRYLHAAGVVHRDVKARNVLVDAAGDLRLGDLGVSRAAASERELLHTVYGTPLYMSPELCEGRPYWSASDMWSLGVMVYELCALQPPFRGASLLGGASSTASTHRCHRTTVASSSTSWPGCCSATRRAGPPRRRWCDGFSRRAQRAASPPSTAGPPWAARALS